jgi:hypothetical protein
MLLCCDAWMNVHLIKHQVFEACRSLALHTGPPAFSQLSWRERQWLEWRSLGLFLRSVEALHIGACLILWELAAMNMIWRNDWYGRDAAWPALLALVWLMPWIAAARRHFLMRALGKHWSTN